MEKLNVTFDWKKEIDKIRTNKWFCVCVCVLLKGRKNTRKLTKIGVRTVRNIIIITWKKKTDTERDT